MLERNMPIKSPQFYVDELERSGLTKQLPDFQGLVVGVTRPPEGKMTPRLRDVILDGRLADVYFWDGSEKRLYLHLK